MVERTAERETKKPLVNEDVLSYLSTLLDGATVAVVNTPNHRLVVYIAKKYHWTGRPNDPPTPPSICVLVGEPDATPEPLPSSHPALPDGFDSLLIFHPDMGGYQNYLTMILRGLQQVKVPFAGSVSVDYVNQKNYRKETRVVPQAMVFIPDEARRVGQGLIRELQLGNQEPTAA